ncbi:MAG: hypothetical protein GX174_13180 [Lentisphaerae bacterium]|jgi:hypothetical protein|nr:hypothetical protein [Lentisphaerota bacterium]
MSSNAHTIEPLAWPTDWQHPSSIQRVSIGVPFIGFDHRVFRALVKKLASRDESVLKMWPSDPTLCRIRDDIAAWLAKTFGWPNTLFHPDDPCAVLFWRPRSDLELSEMLLLLAERFGVSMEVFDRLDQMSFGQLVERIQTEMHDDGT